MAKDLTPAAANDSPWDVLRFTIPLRPRGQMRPRSRAVVTNRGRAFAQTYKDARQRREERKLEALLAEHRPLELIEGQIKLGLKAFFEVPKSKPKWFKRAALAGEIQPVTKPDLDNILKHFKDAATGLLWKDDRQIVGYLDGTGKYYGSPARWEITIMYKPKATP